MSIVSETKLDGLHHVAVSVQNVGEAVDWYTKQFHCKVRYQDETWAMLEFANIRLALVIPSQHPPHIALTSEEAERFGTIKRHRDGTESVYIKDPSGNSIEVLALQSVKD
jgi:catechol 2,3-dioxygenase-like lactoylglutathione lyase family enzyme